VLVIGLRCVRAGWHGRLAWGAGGADG